VNEQIREIMKQAGTDTSGKWMGVDNAEKFAELIAKETISVLQKRFMGDLNREDMEVRRCIADVKKHFGIEE